MNTTKSSHPVGLCCRAALTHLIFIVALLGLLAALAIPRTANAGLLTTPLNASTNSITVAGTNAPMCSVIGPQTNQYQLPGTTVNTNAFSSVYFSFPVARATTLQWSEDVRASGAQTKVLRFAGSLDNYNWVSNFMVIPVVTATGTNRQSFILTNWDSYGVPFLALTTIEITNNANGSSSNQLLNAFIKPGH